MRQKTITRRAFLTVLGASAALSIPLAACTAACAHLCDANHGGWPDALIHNAMDRLENFISWLGTSRGYIGEIGIPSNLGSARDQFYPDQQQWKTLGEYYLDRCDAVALAYTLQEVSEQYYKNKNGGYYASVYLAPGDDVHKVISRPAFQAAQLEAHNRSGVGVNFSGGQKWTSEKEDPVNFNSNTNPGTYDVDYWYATDGSDSTNPATGMNSFQYLASRGVSLARLGFRWERMQPAINGPLSSTELARYKKGIVNARAAGINIVVDVHNYGGYTTSAGKQLLNSSGCPSDAFIDLWKRLSAQFQNETAVIGYDLMNEPNAGGGIAAGTYASPQKAWEAITQQVVSAIRARGDTKRIMVPVYSGIASVAKKHPAGPWIVNGGNIMYTVHQYFDHLDPTTGGGGGDYPISYDDEAAYYASKGW